MSAAPTRRVVQRHGGNTFATSSTASLTSLDGQSAPTNREESSFRPQATKPNSAPHPHASTLTTGRVVEHPSNSGHSTPARGPGSRVNANKRGPDTSASTNSEARVSSAGSIVSRVRIDVATHRHSQQRTAPGDAPRQSRESTTAASSAITSGSHQSICRMERELGRSLPLNGTGSHVMLSSSDLKLVRDPDTLQFLQENSQLFVKYFRETHPHSQPEQDNGAVRVTTADAAEPAPQKNPVTSSHSADDLARQVKALCEEIDTFITAVDYNGKEFQVQVGDDGVLPIPVDVGELWDQEEDRVVLADMEDFTQDELDAFNREFGLADGDTDEVEEDDDDQLEHDTASHAESSPTDIDDEQQTPRTPTDGTPGVSSSHTDNGMSAEDAIRKRFDDHRRLLAMTGELQLQRKLNAVVAHHKGDKPRYMSSTSASKSLTGATTTTPTSALPPSPPPAPVSRRFQVQYCGSRATGAPRVVDMPPSIPVREQRQVLSRDEEQRITFLLDHDNWDTLSMDQIDGSDVVSRGTGDETASVATTRKTAATTALSYDRASTTSYAAACGGYTVDAQSQQRLRDIDSQLELLQRVRDEDAPPTDGLEEVDLAPPTLLATATPAPSSAHPTPRTTAPPSMKGRQQNKPSTVTVAPTTAAAEAEKAAAQKRKAMGDGYLQNYKEDKAVRQQLSSLNGRLSAISNQMDTLMTPPFSFNTTYEMDKDPKEWQWPQDVEKPTEDTIQALMNAATKEQRSAQRTRYMAQLPGAASGSASASRVLINNFVPAELQDAAREAEEAQERGDTVVDETLPPPTSGFFHEQLRERLLRTQALMKEVNQLVDRGVHASHAISVPSEADVAAATASASGETDDEEVPSVDVQQ